MSVQLPKLEGFVVGKPQEYNVDDFIEDENNVNEHSELDLKATDNSLKQFGQVETLVVNETAKKVLGGNGRLRLMKRAGISKFWGISVDGTPNQLKALSIALNKTGRNSDFNYMKLVQSLQDLEHADPKLLQFTGFPDHELKPLLASEFHLPDVEVKETTEIKKAVGTKDLDARGITIQFSVMQKPVIDEALQKIREIEDSAGLSPAEALCKICGHFLTDYEVDE